VLCIPLGKTFELLPAFFSFSALDGACSDFTFYILLGDLALVELNKKGKILQAMAPLKTFLPFEKEKGAIEKNEKRLHQITHNIAEAHPHSKI
jgi:hypothetical protein